MGEYMKYIWLGTCFILGIMFTGCRSAMVRTTYQDVAPADKALISFYYRYNPTAGTPIEIFVDELSYGHVNMRNCLQVEVTPGKHVIYGLMGGNWGVLEADVVAGKKYYVYLNVIFDVISAGRVSFTPITDPAEIQKVAPEFAKSFTVALDPLRKEEWQKKRMSATQKIAARHKAGATKPAKLSPQDGI